MLRFAQVSARLDIELLITQKKRREVSCIYIVCKTCTVPTVLYGASLKYEIYLLQAFSKAEGAAAKSQHEQLQKIHEVLRDATFYSLYCINIFCYKSYSTFDTCCCFSLLLGYGADMETDEVD